MAAISWGKVETALKLKMESLRIYVCTSTVPFTRFARNNVLRQTKPNQTHFVPLKNELETKAQFQCCLIIFLNLLISQIHSSKCRL